MLAPPGDRDRVADSTLDMVPPRLEGEDAAGAGGALMSRPVCLQQHLIGAEITMCLSDSWPTRRRMNIKNIGQIGLYCLCIKRWQLSNM